MLYPRKLEVRIARVGCAHTKQRLDTNCWQYRRHLLCSLMWVSLPDLRHCHQHSSTDRRYSSSGNFSQQPFKNTFQVLINKSSLWGESCPSPCGGWHEPYTRLSLSIRASLGHQFFSVLVKYCSFYYVCAVLFSKITLPRTRSPSRIREDRNCNLRPTGRFCLLRSHYYFKLNIKCPHS